MTSVSSLSINFGLLVRVLLHPRKTTFFLVLLLEHLRFCLLLLLFLLLEDLSFSIFCELFEALGVLFFFLVVDVFLYHFLSLLFKLVSQIVDFHRINFGLFFLALFLGLVFDLVSDIRSSHVRILGLFNVFIKKIHQISFWHNRAKSIVISKFVEE